MTKPLKPERLGRNIKIKISMPVLHWLSGAMRMWVARADVTRRPPGVGGEAQRLTSGTFRTFRTFRTYHRILASNEFFGASAAPRRHRARAAPSLRRFWHHWPLCQSPPMHCFATFTLSFTCFSPFFVIFNTRPRCLALSFLERGGSPERGGFRGSPYAVWATPLRKID